MLRFLVKTYSCKFLLISLFVIPFYVSGQNFEEYLFLFRNTNSILNDTQKNIIGIYSQMHNFLFLDGMSLNLGMRHKLNTKSKHFVSEIGMNAESYFNESYKVNIGINNQDVASDGFSIAFTFNERYVSLSGWDFQLGVAPKFYYENQSKNLFVRWATSFLIQYRNFQFWSSFKNNNPGTAYSQYSNVFNPPRSYFFSSQLGSNSWNINTSYNFKSSNYFLLRPYVSVYKISYVLVNIEGFYLVNQGFYKQPEFAFGTQCQYKNVSVYPEISVGKIYPEGFWSPFRYGLMTSIDIHEKVTLFFSFTQLKNLIRLNKTYVNNEFNVGILYKK